MAGTSMSILGLPPLSQSSYNSPALSTDLSSGMQFNAFPTGGGQNPINASSDLLSRESMFGQNGWAMPAAQIGAGALQSFLGLKQLKLAKDMFRQQSEYAATDLANQAKTVNERLETRQNRRLAEGTSTVPTSEFMSKYAVSGKAGG